MLGDGPAHLSQTGQRVLAGLLATMREFSLLFAPNINSYKRYQPGSFAPTALRWGVDNRTCALRVVGHGQGMRVENRVPGGDVNPYLAIAGLVAGALHGIDSELELGDECTGNAYDDRRPSGSPAPCATPWPSGRAPLSPGGVRRRGGGPLRQPGEGRAGRLRRGGDGLGADPRLRASVIDGAGGRA